MSHYVDYFSLGMGFGAHWTFIMSHKTCKTNSSVSKHSYLLVVDGSCTVVSRFSVQKENKRHSFAQASDFIFNNRHPAIAMFFFRKIQVQIFENKEYINKKYIKWHDLLHYFSILGEEL